MLFYRLGFFFFLISNVACSQSRSLKDHVIFYASFDGKVTADMAVGDAQLYTAESYDKTDAAKAGLHNPDVILAKEEGLAGDALYFTKKNTSAIYYSGYKNLGYSAQSWSGSFSFWLKLDPEKDLAPGYCDPINLTDTKYNDAALWVDFTDDTPRQFRLGAIGDLNVWNPENKSDETAWEKRTVTVEQPPFKGGKWTHIVIAYSKLNTNQSECTLYLDGQYKGVVKDVNDPFTWKEENAKIMIGLSYVGMMDELTVFDKALDLDEVKSVYALKSGMKTIIE